MPWGGCGHTRMRSTCCPGLIRRLCPGSIGGLVPGRTNILSTTVRGKSDETGMEHIQPRLPDAIDAYLNDRINNAPRPCAAVDAILNDLFPPNAPEHPERFDGMS